MSWWTWCWQIISVLDVIVSDLLLLNLSRCRSPLISYAATAAAVLFAVVSFHLTNAEHAQNTHIFPGHFVSRNGVKFINKVQPQTPADRSPNFETYVATAISDDDMNATGLNHGRVRGKLFNLLLEKMAAVDWRARCLQYYCHW